MDKKSELTSTAEEYLEAILNLRMEGKSVMAALLAKRLGVSPPTVTGALRRLKRNGLISVNPNKKIKLTKKDEGEALKVVRRTSGK